MKFAPITGLFGSNSSGKSSLIQLLLLLKQTAESTDRNQALNFGDEKSYVSLGSFRDVVFSHNVESTVDWQVQWKSPREIRIADPSRKSAVLFSGSDVSLYSQVYLEKATRVRVKEFRYQFDSASFGMRQKKSGGYDLFTENRIDFRFIRALGRPWDLPDPMKSYGFPDQVRAYYQNAAFLGELELSFEELFSRVYYLGPLRRYPEREYAWSGAQPADMGRSGENAVAALLASRERGIKISRGRGRPKFTVEEYVAYWLKELGLIHSFRVEALAKDSNLYRAWVRKAQDAPEVLITDVGFGVSQILPVLAICYYVPENSTILLEHPEIHLHPSAQSSLADVFIDACKFRNVQIVVESHSEHLLRRLQRRIAEEELADHETALYFCRFDKGTSKVTRLQLDIFGNIYNWPKEFFGDTYGEMAAFAEAGLRRRVGT